jgi:serine/threonine-protein kinase HipA
LVRAALALSAQAPINENIRRLLRPGAAVGGARPKAIIQNHGEAWIAKFPTLDDEVDDCAVEHASLKLAESCGITVPESCLVDIAGRNVLLVKRFDRDPGGRLHLASARTMLIAAGLAEDEMGYGDLSDVVCRVSAAPTKTCHELFRRMAVNVLIDNTDDHAKNHAFLYRDGLWYLSPAYDMLPQRQGVGYQQLKVGKRGHEPSLDNILSDSVRFLLKRNEANEILAEVMQRLAKWPEIFRREGVAPRDIDACAGYVMKV